MSPFVRAEDVARAAALLDDEPDAAHALGAMSSPRVGENAMKAQRTTAYRTPAPPPPEEDTILREARLMARQLRLTQRKLRAEALIGSNDQSTFRPEASGGLGGELLSSTALGIGYALWKTDSWALPLGFFAFIVAAFVIFHVAVRIGHRLTTRALGRVTRDLERIRTGAPTRV